MSAGVHGCRWRLLLTWLLALRVRPSSAVGSSSLMFDGSVPAILRVFPPLPATSSETRVAVPDFQSLMRPCLAVHQDRQPHTPTDLRDRLAAQMHVSNEDRAVMGRRAGDTPEEDRPANGTQMSISIVSPCPTFRSSRHHQPARRRTARAS